MINRMRFHNLLVCASVCSLPIGVVGAQSMEKKKLPNILYIMSDDHTSQAVSAYGGVLSDVLPTPNIDRLAHEGAILQNCFVTNSISTPSRACILTGQYSQKNGVYTLADSLDSSFPTSATYLHTIGYQTAIIGKWHLGSEPAGFDFYNVLPGQGVYDNPGLIKKGDWHAGKNGMPRQTRYEGHSTDIIGEEAVRYLSTVDKDKPFFLMCHFKAPHRPWKPAARFNELLKDVQVPEPDNLLDTYQGKGRFTKEIRMGLEFMNHIDLKGESVPEGLSLEEKRHWIYQRYIKDYLRCVAGVDENVGRILKYLDDNGLTENTIVVYTGDQGFFLGEHGWFDKRLMYDEALRMPFLIRYPKEITPGTVNDDIILNIDFAPLFLDYAGLEVPAQMQGQSFRKNLQGKRVRDWRKSMYYRYWQHADGAHNATAHYGIRTERYKLVYYYARSLGKTGTSEKPLVPEWELYDLKEDPMEMNNIYHLPASQKLVKKLKTELLELKKKYEDEDVVYPEMQELNKEYFW